MFALIPKNNWSKLKVNPSRPTLNYFWVINNSLWIPKEISKSIQGMHVEGKIAV